ncbi:zf-TFIIB domain-containing protein [Streptomyces sp. SID13031]|uniref:TFIIB-type zinc ribbon-containing protein n=1 Tax=Streptomyces sp. SID13031 TaxID=2706046 RepID=UPI001945A1A1|nr:zf-TFIIB domain-containing protein [Streptomyces sp. SID13031]
MTCPKCRGSMRTYERSGVTVDQCTECRGIFLDRGELEKLVDAEISFNGPQPVQQPVQQVQPRYEEKRYEDKRRYDNDRDRYQQYPQRKKKKSFFDELFD